MSSIKDKNREIMNITLDETKSTVKKTTEEAIKEIPRYTKAVNEYQEESIQAAKEIADNFLESQKRLSTHFSPYGFRMLKMYRTHIGLTGLHQREPQKVMQEQ